MVEHVQSSAGPGPDSRSLPSWQSPGTGTDRRAPTQSRRHRLVIAAAGGALIAACTWVRAADEPPPLDQIKGDLKTVKTDNTLESNASSAGPKLAMPVFIPTPEERTTPPPAIALPGAAENKRTTDSNWLLHAMEPLSGSQQTRRARQAGAQQGELKTPDPSDPNYMLSVYRAQETKDRKDREAQGRETRSLDEKPGDFGSFSDLFQHWIAPQDLKLFGAKPDVPTVLNDGFTLPEDLPPVAPPEPPAAATPPKPNPFLDSTQPLFLQPDVPEAAPAPHADSNLPPPPHNPPETPPATLPPDSRRDTAPPARSTEDKKYFPQLDRF